MTGPVPVAEALSMPLPQKFPAVARLRQHFDAPPPTDADLLGRFAASRDEDAFRELVRRHGPSVLAVCRRVAGNRDDADDAFQATFLVLARKPGRVRAGSPLGAWLYGVAVRAARKAVARTARRRGWESAVGELPEMPDRPPASDPETVRAVLEEVARLSGPYRAAVVLCELEGRPRAAAARELGIPEGTLSSRLAAARKLLARRFRDRGLAPAVLAGVAGSAACPVLAADAARLAGFSASPVPRVEQLSEAVMRTAFLSNWKLAPVAAVLAAVGLGVTAADPSAARPDNPKPTVALFQPAPGKKPAPPAPKKAGPGTLLLVREGPCQLLTPDGKTVSEFAAPAKTHNSGGGCLSPDGTRVAVVVGEDGPPPPVVGEVGWPFKVVVRALGKPGPEKTWDTRAMTLDLHWTADGKRLVVVKCPDADDRKNVENLLLDPETGETEPLDLPAGVWVLDAARDGKTFLVALAEGKKAKLGLAATGDAAVRELVEVPDWRPGRVFGRLSPDGTKVLCAVPDPGRKNAHHFGVSQRPYLLDVKTKKAEPLPDFPENGWVTGVAWSPDGRRIAYTWQQLHEELLKKDTLSGNDTEIETEAFLIVAGADGKDPKTVASDKGRFALNVIFGAIDWR